MRPDGTNCSLTLRLLAAASVLVLSACGSMKPLPSDAFYRLNVPGAAPAAKAWTEVPVRVAKFSASGVHRDRPIAYSGADSVVVGQHRYDLWIDSPERMLQNELVRYLRDAHVAPIVTGSSVSGAAVEVRGRIDRLDHVVESDAPGVVVELHLELALRGKRDAVVFARAYRESRTLAGGGMAAVAGAMSEAVGAIFAQFAADAGGALQGDTNVRLPLED
ncbi:MAG: ABC-type transport auxiliary lipoprotein family protein [Gammaproteobacteria bacterium]|jgi:ABC-type uncharacterized transport system auxiliary subunit